MDTNNNAENEHERVAGSNIPSILALSPSFYAVLEMKGLLGAAYQASLYTVPIFIGYC